MGQNYQLLSTERVAATPLPSRGDLRLASSELLPLGFMCLFEASDVVELPWCSDVVRQLTLFARKDRALARMRRGIPAASERFARELESLADGRVRDGLTDCPRPTTAEVRAHLEGFASHIASAPGDHIQALLHDSYLGWGDDLRGDLLQFLEVGHGTDDGWRYFLRFWGFVGNGWSAEVVPSSLVGVPHVPPSPYEHDRLAAALTLPDEWPEFSEMAVSAVLAFVLEESARYVSATGSPPWFSDVLGAISRLLGDRVRLRVATGAGECIATLPPPMIGDRLSAGCFAPLATRTNDALFKQLSALWKLAASGAFADGPLECTGLDRDARPLVSSRSKPLPYPVDPVTQVTHRHRAPPSRQADKDRAVALAFKGTADARVHLIREWRDALEEHDWRRLVTDPNPTVRVEVATAKNLRGFRSLHPVLATERHPAVRIARASADELVLLAGHPDATWRRAVAKREEVPVRSLFALAADPDPQVRLATYATLGRRRGPAFLERAVVGALTRLGRDPEPSVRDALETELASSHYRAEVRAVLDAPVTRDDPSARARMPSASPPPAAVTPVAAAEPAPAPAAKPAKSTVARKRPQ